MASNRKYKCPFCKLHDTKEKLIHHIDKKHEDMIPEGFTAGRVLFHFIHKKPYDEKGKCVICKGDTNWNEKTYKYNRLCDNRACKEKLRENYKKNMLRVFGTYNILNDMEQQEKMLKNRSISGIYKFQNGKIKDYVGSYEKKFLEFCDLMLGMEPDDIIMPGPTIEYNYKGQKHKWITDALIIPYNLVLDIKDGGMSPNNREMVSYREKQIEKEKVITSQGEYNYLRLTDNQFPQLIAIMYELKLQNLDNPESNKTISRVHESTQPIFISEDDLEIKLDDWKDGKIKCLFIAGMSGGGKSTLANNLAKEYGAIMIEMDLIRWFLKVGKAIPVEPPYKLIDWHKYKTHKPYPDDKEIERISTDKPFKKNMICDYLEWVIQKSPKQFVIEGPIDDIAKYRPNLLEEGALIVKGTSTLTSVIRRIKRDFTRTDRPMDGIGIKYLAKVLFKDYPKYQKDMNLVRNYVDKYNESSDEEMKDDISINTFQEKEYDRYLKIHKKRIIASYNERVYALKQALQLSDTEVNELRDRILKHDESRYSPEEWDNWRKSYFPENEEEKKEGKKTEELARKHHYKMNAHHPQHWNGKEMDKVSIAEMIIDWEADSRADGGNPLKWFLYSEDAEDTKKELNEKTKEEVERVLQTIYDIGMNLKDNFDKDDDPVKTK